MNASQWSVWLANLDPVVGSEQGRTRPVLVISDTSLNNILPVVNNERVVNQMTECQKLARRFNEDEAVWAGYIERRRVRHLVGVNSLLTEDILDWLDWLEAERECREFRCVARARELRISELRDGPRIYGDERG